MLRAVCIICNALFPVELKCMDMAVLMVRHLLERRKEGERDRRKGERRERWGGGRLTFSCLCFAIITFRSSLHV